MTRRWHLTIGVASSGILVALMHAALAATFTPISVTFRSDFNQLGVTGDQIGSDNTGLTYNNGPNVEATLDPSGDLHLDTNLHSRSGGRSLGVAFEQPASSCSNCPPPPNNGKPALVEAFVSTSLVAVGNKVVGLPGMPVGSTGVANLNINFSGWFVRYNPSNYSGSTTVTVTREDERNWTITAAAPQAAGLIKLSNGGKTETDAGTFFMPTQITINCPTC